MFQAVLRMLFIVMMLTTFVGQAITFNASTTCQTTEEFLSSNSNEKMTHHESAPLNTNSSEDCCGIECCGEDCRCIANACSSFVYFNKNLGSTRHSADSNVVFIPYFEQPKSIATLLYRPPILTL